MALDGDHTNPVECSLLADLVGIHISVTLKWIFILRGVSCFSDFEHYSSVYAELYK